MLSVARINEDVQAMKTLTDTASQTLAHVANIDLTTSEMKENIDAMAEDSRRIYGKVDDMERGED